MRKNVIFALVLMGFTSLVTQALYIREFLVTFYGNELTVGLILACWILSKSIGSGFAARFTGKTRSPLLAYASLQVFIAIYLPVAVLLIRNAKSFITVSPGEGVGILPILASCIVIVGPLSACDGVLFPLGCRIYSECSKKSHETAGRVYILEAIGFVLAGPIFTYILLSTMSSIRIALTLGLLNLISGLFLLQKERPCALKKPLRALIAVLLAACAVTLLSAAGSMLNQYSLSLQWKDQNLIKYKNSAYGNLAVSRNREQYTFYSNAVPLINIPSPDTASTEELVHFVMLSHPAPKRLLFIGGGIGGPISEALKYSPGIIDYAQIDPLLITLVKKFPTGITSGELNNPIVHIIIEDGVRLVKNAGAKYNIVFISLPPPSTLQLNRYYTKEFFAQIKKIVFPNGRVVLTLPGSLSYINHELRQLNLCVLKTLEGVFPNILVIPGYSNIYIASSEPIKITPEILMERLKARHILTDTFDEFHIKDRLQKYWQDWFYATLNKRVGGQETRVKENRNLVPIGVFYGISYWNSLFNPSLRKLFTLLGGLNSKHLIFLIIALFLTVIASERKRAKQSLKTDCFGASRLTIRGVAVSIATTGFTGMSLNLIFIFSYQIFFGYVYRDIALLTTSFMFGLAAGALFAAKNLNPKKNTLCWFTVTEVLIIIFCLSAGLSLKYLNTVGTFAFYPLFYILSALSGLLAGAQFPMANKIYKKYYTSKKNKQPIEKSAGVLYSMDLLGGFFAALLIPVIFIPILGILQICLLLAFVKAAGLILYIPSRR